MKSQTSVLMIFSAITIHFNKKQREFVEYLQSSVDFQVLKKLEVRYSKLEG